MEKLKDKKIQIEGLWCVLGGFCFTVFARVLENGNPSSAFTFGWNRDIWDMDEWFYAGRNFRFEENSGHFVFGFLLTLVLIWSIKKYRSIN